MPKPTQTQAPERIKDAVVAEANELLAALTDPRRDGITKAGLSNLTATRFAKWIVEHDAIKPAPAPDIKLLADCLRADAEYAQRCANEKGVREDFLNLKSRFLVMAERIEAISVNADIREMCEAGNAMKNAALNHQMENTSTAYGLLGKAIKEWDALITRAAQPKVQE